MYPTLDIDKQLDQWVKGFPQHSGSLQDGRCCPDFSCCSPKLMWPEELRKKFVESDYLTKVAMFSMTTTAAAIEDGDNEEIEDDIEDEGIH